jgi:hypothetical protein
VSLGSIDDVDVPLLPPRGEIQDTIDLPEDEPQLVQLLLEYIYEGEYDPRLPRDEARELPDGPPVVTAPKESNYHYGFPHTCKLSCPSPEHRVCHHHSCLQKICREHVTTSYASSGAANPIWAANQTNSLSTRKCTLSATSTL